MGNGVFQPGILMPGCDPGSVHEEEGENGHHAGTTASAQGTGSLCAAHRGGGHRARSSAVLPCWGQPVLVAFSLLMGFAPLELPLHHSQPLTPGRILRGALLRPKSALCTLLTLRSA